MVEDKSVVVNVMLSLTCVMSPPPDVCNVLGCSVVMLCTLGDFALGVRLFSKIEMIYACVL